MQSVALVAICESRFAGVAPPGLTVARALWRCSLWTGVTSWSDLASEYVTADVKWHGGTLGTVESAENLVGLLRGFIGALPDLNAQEQDIVAAGTLAVRFVVEATHEGDLLGIAPTGRKVRWNAVDLYRLRDGKISEEWAADDMAAILHQVGAYTPPWLS